MLCNCMVIAWFTISISVYKVISAQILSPKRASFDGESEVFYQGICIHSEVTTMNIQCRDNQKLKILRIVYGYNQQARNAMNAEYCTFSIKDCYFDKDYAIDDECTGKSQCDIVIRKSTLIKDSLFYKQSCRDFNYIQINFQCLPNIQTIDICEITQVQLSQAYIVSPSYPSGLVSGTKCECHFKSNNKDGQILLRRLDMKLPGNTKTNELCEDAFLNIVENNRRSERKCGYIRETGSIFGSGANELKFTFSTSERQNWNDKGFWLELQASPPTNASIVDIKCNKEFENVYIQKKLKSIEEKLRSRLTKYTLKALKQSTKPNLYANNKILAVSGGRNLSKITGKSLPSKKTNSDANAGQEIKSEILDYDAIRDILDRELNEIIIDGMTKTTTEIPGTTTTVPIKTTIYTSSKRSYSPITRPLGKSIQNDKLKSSNIKEGLNEWNKALFSGKSNGQNENEVESASTDSNDSSEAKKQTNSLTAAQQQDSTVSTDTEINKKSNMAIFTGIGVSIVIVAIVLNMAVCYSCYKKKIILDGYSDNYQSESSLNLPAECAIKTFTKLCSQLAHCLFRRSHSDIAKNHEETYSEYYTGSVPVSSHVSTIVAKRENDRNAIIYDPNSIYSASMASDLASDLERSYYLQDFPHLQTHNEHDESQDEYYEKFNRQCDQQFNKFSKSKSKLQP